VSSNDSLTPEQRSERMALVKGWDTGPEKRVRQALRSLGFHYRLQARELPGRPDIVFRRRKAALFVYGCFWHRHPDPRCKLARLPKSRLDFWLPKLEGNRRRDLANQARLRSLGWKVIVIWECQTLNLMALRAKLTAELGES
jgi:DNA mismatch endonuclease (patch repair protein)